MARESKRNIWLDCTLLFALGSALPLWIGHRLLFRCGYVDWGALSDVARAFDVFRLNIRPQLSLIGFADPPLPAVLQLPIAGLFPDLSTSGYAACVVMAVAAGSALLALNALLAELGLARRARYVFVAAWQFNPLVLYWAASGRAEILLALLMMLGLRQIVRWRGSGLHRDMLLAGLLLSLVAVVRYEAIFFVLAVSLGIGVLLRTEDNVDGAQIEGMLIAFTLPTVYVAGLWVLAKWAIVGHPFAFWADTFTAPAAQIGWSGLANGLMCLIRAFWAANSAFPLFLAALLVFLIPLGSRNRLLAVFGCVGLSVPLYFGTLAAWRLPGSASWQDTLGRPTVALSGLVFGLVLAAGIWQSGWWRPSARRADRVKVVAGLAAAAAVFFGPNLLPNGPVADAAHNVRVALAGRSGSLAMYTVEKDIAREALAYAGQGPVLIHGELSFAIRLFSGQPRSFISLERLQRNATVTGGEGLPRWYLRQVLPAGARAQQPGPVSPADPVRDDPRLKEARLVKNWGYWQLFELK